MREVPSVHDLVLDSLALHASSCFLNHAKSSCAAASVGNDVEAVVCMLGDDQVVQNSTLLGHEHRKGRGECRHRRQRSGSEVLAET